MWAAAATAGLGHRPEQERGDWEQPWLHTALGDLLLGAGLCIYDINMLYICLYKISDGGPGGPAHCLQPHVTEVTTV